MAITADTTYTLSDTDLDGNLTFHGTLTDSVPTTILISNNLPRVWEMLKRTGDGEIWFIVDWDGTQNIVTTKDGAHVLPAAISARNFATKSTETYIRMYASANVEYSLTLVV